MFSKIHIFSISNFTVISPSTIRRGKPFNVIVKGFNLKDTEKITLEISGVNATGHQISQIKTAIISESRPKVMIQFVVS